MPVDDVETVVVAIAERDAIDVAAKYVLDKKGGDRALAKSHVGLGPFVAHARSAGIGAPDFGKSGI